MTPSADHTPLVSIIVPVKNGACTLDTCLRAIHSSHYKNVEVIVVDDHSTDDTVQIAKSCDSTVLELTEGHGANFARNLGAKHAEGEVLLFIDSDVIVQRDTILSIVENLEENGLDAVVGLYTTKHRHETFVSQYKNLWVRYSYLKSPPAIDWLFGAISGIKREAFEKLGGFDVDLMAHRGSDDLELGKRFARNKLSIMLNMDIEVEHLKNYTLWGLIKNEFHRSIGLAELATKLGETPRSLTRGFVNVYPSFVISTVLVVPVLLLVLGAALKLVPAWLAIAAAGLYLVLNARFLNYLEQVRGLFAMIVMIPILVIDHAVCFFGSILGVLRGMTGK